jgi:mycothiol synthase
VHLDVTTTTLDQLSHSDRHAADVAVEAAARALGTPPRNDHLGIEWEHASPHGLVTLVRHGDRTIAVGQLAATAQSSTVEIAVHPLVADDPTGDAAQHLALRALATERRERHLPSISWWVTEPTARHQATAAAAGLIPERRLHLMRVVLPLERTASVETRSFRPGTDDDAWLTVNNRAFAGHPEQGNWQRDDLRGRLDEPWFNADGFRLHERDGRLAAFCWTKDHPATEHDPAMGEIYVIAVDPDFHGLGLGRELALAGLDSIAGRGHHVGMLYVTESNTAAMRLYESMGFRTHLVRQAFVEVQ